MSSWLSHSKSPLNGNMLISERLLNLRVWVWYFQLIKRRNLKREQIRLYIADKSNHRGKWNQRIVKQQHPKQLQKVFSNVSVNACMFYRSWSINNHKILKLTLIPQIFLSHILNKYSGPSTIRPLYWSASPRYVATLCMH